MTASQPRPRSLATLARFGAVGGLTAAIYVLGFSALIGIGLQDVPASIAAYLTAIAVQFAGHQVFTFQTAGKPGRTLGRFLIANSLGLALSTALVVTLRDGLGADGLTTGVTVTLVLAAMNWVIFKNWVFRA